jgi:hypothetical protein
MSHESLFIRKDIVSLGNLTAFSDKLVYFGNQKVPIGDRYRKALPGKFLLVERDRKGRRRLSIK